MLPKGLKIHFQFLLDTVAIIQVDIDYTLVSNLTLCGINRNAVNCFTLINQLNQNFKNWIFHDV